ncbi:NAD(P)/FAD-dependent oxidoreductase [Streptomyces sp. NPDC053474]|uniref:NAD(P)/FAD-dependent oxidoreductase n=1 Tax=Streptomyces sp. NPDC053474 TaxID=3365704 RepID=UPI0037D57173
MDMQHVVVLGSSIAGLAAARVVRQAGIKVIIVEPDDLVAGVRPGVPQLHQVHALLDMGRTQLDRLFPGLTHGLVEDGAVLASGNQIAMYASGTRKVGVPGNELIGTTRELLESHVRRRMFSDSAVELVRGRGVGLRFTGDRVSGVRYQAVGSTRVADLSADAVIDATGRSSRLAAWLEDGGWQAPAVDRIGIDLGYATAVFRRADELPGLKVAHATPVVAATTADQADTGALAAVEGDRWMAVIAAYGDRRPSRDPAEFLKRMQGIEASPFGVVAERCEMLSPVHTYRMAHSLRRDYAGLQRLPGGLFAVGDAVASYNPVYGQGMTSAALHASCLAAYLRRGNSLHAPARAYFEHIAVIVNAAWSLSTVADLAQPHVTGPYPRGYRLIKKSADLITRASVTDPWVNERFLDVVNMRRHPAQLQSPAFLWRVGRALLAQRCGR